MTAHREDECRYLATGESMHYELKLMENNISNNRPLTTSSTYTDLYKMMTGYGPVGQAVRNHLTAKRWMARSSVERTAIDEEFSRFLKDFSALGDVADYGSFILAQANVKAAVPMGEAADAVICAIVDRFFDCAIRLDDGGQADVGLKGLTYYPTGFTGVGLHGVCGEKALYVHRTEGKLGISSNAFLLPGDYEKYLETQQQVRDKAFSALVEKYWKPVYRRPGGTFPEWRDEGLRLIMEAAYRFEDAINAGKGRGLLNDEYFSQKNSYGSFSVKINAQSSTAYPIDSLARIGKLGDWLDTDMCRKIHQNGEIGYTFKPVFRDGGMRFELIDVFFDFSYLRYGNLGSWRISVVNMFGNNSGFDLQFKKDKSTPDVYGFFDVLGAQKDNPLDGGSMGQYFHDIAQLFSVVEAEWIYSIVAHLNEVADDIDSQLQYLSKPKKELVLNRIPEGWRKTLDLL